MFKFDNSESNWKEISKKMPWEAWLAISGCVYFVFGIIFLGLWFFQKWQRKKEKEEEKGQTVGKPPSDKVVPSAMPGGAVIPHSGPHMNGLPSKPSQIV